MFHKIVFDNERFLEKSFEHYSKMCLQKNNGFNIKIWHEEEVFELQGFNKSLYARIED